MAEWSFPLAEWSFPLAEWSFPLAEWSFPLAEGSFSLAEGSFSLAEGSFSLAEGSFPLAEGSFPLANGDCQSEALGLPFTDGWSPLSLNCEKKPYFCRVLPFAQEFRPDGSAPGPPSRDPAAPPRQSP